MLKFKISIFRGTTLIRPAKHGALRCQHTLTLLREFPSVSTLKKISDSRSAASSVILSRCLAPPGISLFGESNILTAPHHRVCFSILLWAIISPQNLFVNTLKRKSLNSFICLSQNFKCCPADKYALSKERICPRCQSSVCFRFEHRLFQAFSISSSSAFICSSTSFSALSSGPSSRQPAALV